jgi:prepilin-type N-terminal cleavage/methylation domain-containing protein
LHKALSNARRDLGFTLAELLVVLGIIAVLSALLFPVFRAVRAGALRTSCASNFRQAQLAMTLYIDDYDERFVPVNHFPAAVPDPVRDRTWVQLLLPYTSSFGMFRCPSDKTSRPATEGVFEEGVLPADTSARFYLESLRVNLGYNYLYYSPVVGTASGWQVQTRAFSQVTEPARALLMVDSVHSLDKSERPQGGGSYVVIPPCRYGRQGRRFFDSFDLPPNTRVLAASQGWDLANPLNAFRYGLAWPWHDGRMNIGRVGGGSVSVTPKMLSIGCDARSFWTGFIEDWSKYYWDGG